MHIENPLATSILQGSLGGDCGAWLWCFPTTKQDHVNFFCISCSRSFSNYTCRNRHCHFRRLSDVLNALHSCCIFSFLGEMLSLKKFTFRQDERLHGIWSHGVPDWYSCVPPPPSINFRCSQETWRIWIAGIFVGIYPGVILKGKMRSLTAAGVGIGLWAGAAVMLNSHGRGWQCPAAWSVQALVLEEHQVTMGWGSSQGCLELAPGNFLCNTAPVITKLGWVGFYYYQARMGLVVWLRLVENTSEHCWSGGGLKASGCEFSRLEQISFTGG